jgi:ubiquinone/menaquinone biosynthesis C-methylase UbiE
MAKNYQVWKTAELSRNFLDGVRGAIPLAGEQIEIMLRIIKTFTGEVNNFLDLGCGDGILGRAISESYPHSQGVLLDLSETMIKTAREKCSLSESNLFYVQEDFGNSAWVNSVKDYAPFDVIVSGFSIHHQTDERKKGLYAEIYNLLQAGGVFLNLEHVASRSNLGEKLFDELFVDSLYAYHHNLGSQESREEIDRKYYNRADKKANILATVELQCSWLRELGFIHVDCFFKIFEIALFGGVKPTRNNQ